jgi:putative (di)nucleoside polyphosphate hydrolase
MTTLPTLITPATLGLPYRMGVGIMLLNVDGRVWTGRRRPKWSENRASHIWQMPQGGIAKGESPREAALRELREETAIKSAVFLAEHPRWLTYDLPTELIGIALKGKYRGQCQRWFAMKFMGDDSEIDIGSRRGVKAEFDRWAWRRPDELAELVVPFKRKVYEAVISDFAQFWRV